MSAKVSVIIPVYNTEALLPRCLESVVAQTLSDIEIICVDDGSTDGSLRLLNEWAARDSRIRVIHQSNGRQGKARNAGMAIAKGEYIGFIDSDDYIPVEYFERLYEAAKEVDADMAICGIVKQKPLGNKRVIGFERNEVFDTAAEKFTVCSCPPNFHPVNKLYRRAMLDSIELRFAEGVQYEDVMFVTRALAESGRLVTVSDVWYCYVLNPHSTVKSRQTAAKQRQRYEAHRSMVDYLTSRGIFVAPRHRNITVRYKELCGVCLWKIKEGEKWRTVRLFDLLPVWCYKRR